MAPSSTPWDELKVEELKRLWSEGYSASIIADMLGGGMTRCGVLGKINRLGLDRRRPPLERKPYTRPVKRGRPIPTYARMRRPVFVEPSVFAKATTDKPPSAPPPCEPPQKPRMRRLQLMQLQEHHCRWPYGDPHRHPFYFCAADRATGDPYCAFHMRKAFARSRGEK